MLTAFLVKYVLLAMLTRKWWLREVMWAAPREITGK